MQREIKTIVPEASPIDNMETGTSDLNFALFPLQRTDWTEWWVTQVGLMVMVVYNTSSKRQPAFYLSGENVASNSTKGTDPCSISINSFSWTLRPLFRRRYFQMHSCEWQVLNFWLKFDWLLFLRVQKTIIQYWLRLWLCADKPLSEPMVTHALTHICGTMGRWVNKLI